MDKFKKVQKLSPAKVDNHPDERRRERKRARRILKQEELEEDVVEELDGIRLKSRWYFYCEECHTFAGRSICSNRCECWCHAHPGSIVTAINGDTVIMSAMNTKYPDEEHTPSSVRKSYRPSNPKSSVELLAESVKKP